MKPSYSEKESEQQPAIVKMFGNYSGGQGGFEPLLSWRYLPFEALFVASLPFRFNIVVFLETSRINRIPEKIIPDQLKEGFG